MWIPTYSRPPTTTPSENTIRVLSSFLESNEITTHRTMCLRSILPVVDVIWEWVVFVVTLFRESDKTLLQSYKTLLQVTRQSQDKLLRRMSTFFGLPRTILQTIKLTSHLPLTHFRLNYPTVRRLKSSPKTRLGVYQASTPSSDRRTTSLWFLYFTPHHFPFLKIIGLRSSTPYRSEYGNFLVRL